MSMVISISSSVDEGSSGEGLPGEDKKLSGMVENTPVLQERKHRETAIPIKHPNLPMIPPFLCYNA
jgi:hypothetical protein